MRVLRILRFEWSSSIMSKPFRAAPRRLRRMSTRAPCRVGMRRRLGRDAMRFARALMMGSRGGVSSSQRLARLRSRWISSALN